LSKRRKEQTAGVRRIERENQEKDDGVL
jgi:hypothetical protein